MQNSLHDDIILHNIYIITVKPCTESVQKSLQRVELRVKCKILV